MANPRQPKNPRTGRFAPSPSSPQILWSRPGIAGFAAWFKDIKPRVLTARNTYEPIKLTRTQGEALKQILSVDDGGKLKFSIALLVWARRHGKSTLFALVVLWLFTTRQNYTIQLLGNSSDHVRKTQYNLVKRIILHTPALRKMVGEENLFTGEIRNPRKGNTIQSTSVSFGASFGEKLTLLWVSDLHACPDLQPFNAMQASLLDSEESLILIDANVDATDGPVHALQSQAEEDPGIFAHHLEYTSFEHFEAEAPPWIDRKKAKRLKSTLLPAEFDRDILCKRGDAKNSLFTRDIIESCFDHSYQIPVTPEGLKALVKGRAYRVGAGLDRAKNLLNFGGTDNTVLTVIAKCASLKFGEPEFFVLDQKAIIPNLSRSVKKAIIEAHQKYPLTNCILENYEVSDLYSWLLEQRIPVELLNAHESSQNIIFPEIFRVAREGRLHFPANMSELVSELGTFSYQMKSNGKFSFGHQQVRFKDDRCYSLAYSLFSLRESVLHSYVLGSFACKNKSPNRHHCFLMDGELILHCGEGCQAFQQVNSMWMSYREQLLDSELTLVEFFEIKVRREGARISMAA
jgi:hypothetical protein